MEEHFDDLDTIAIKIDKDLALMAEILYEF